MQTGAPLIVFSHTVTDKRLSMRTHGDSMYAAAAIQLRIFNVQRNFGQLIYLDSLLSLSFGRRTKSDKH